MADVRRQDIALRGRQMAGEHPVRTLWAIYDVNDPRARRPVGMAVVATPPPRDADARRMASDLHSQERADASVMGSTYRRGTIH